MAHLSTKIEKYCSNMGVASVDFQMDAWGVDVAVSGSQKGFMLPTGLCIVGVSNKALSNCSGSSVPSGYFNFHQMKKMNNDGFFPYTPAMTLMRGLRASIDLLNNEGLSNVVARHNRLANGVRAAVDDLALDICMGEAVWWNEHETFGTAPRARMRQSDQTYGANAVCNFRFQ